jgi:hypothetical protein
MKDRIGDGRRHADERDLTKPFHAERIDVGVDLVDEMRLELRDIEVHG